MTPHETVCDVERLEALVRGELPAPEAEAARAHAAGCAECAAELALLTEESERFARRRDAEPPLPPALWEAVAARTGIAAHTPIARRPARRLPWSSIAALGAVAAGLVVTLSALPRSTPVSVAHRPAAESEAATVARTRTVLERAERQYREALEVLEAAFRKERTRLEPAAADRLEAAFVKARTQLAEASARAGDDLEARVQLVDAYAETLHAIQSTVAGSGIANEGDHR